MRCLQARAVTYLPLRGEPLHALLGIAYRTDESSAVVLNFIAAARRRPRGV
jgi:hypothetical protein